tara:strand:- start:400 stop:807 length:408 start_codon:yes stop_codon:yes gene_type:complete
MTWEEQLQTNNEIKKADRRAGRKWEVSQDDIIIPLEEWRALNNSIEEFDRRSYVIRKLVESGNLNTVSLMETHREKLLMQLDYMDKAMEKLNESLEEAHKIEGNPEEFQPMGRSKGGDEWTRRVDRLYPKKKVIK